MTSALPALLLLGRIVAFSADPPPQTPSVATVLQDARDRARSDARWRSPTVRERDLVQAFVTDLALEGWACSPAALALHQARLAEVDLTVTLHGADDARWLLLAEGATHRGAGLYALRCGDARPVAWQAPHATSDLRTGDIVVQLFSEGRARAGAWSTMARYAGVPGETEADVVHVADPAHTAGSLFQAFSVALAAADPDIRFVQVHGFADRGTTWTAVPSHGTAGPVSPALATALAGVLGPVSTTDPRFLGTGNTLGRSLARFAPPRFLHLELSTALRLRLSEEPSLRASLRLLVEDAPW